MRGKPVLGNLRLSSKIDFSDAVPEDSKLSSVWGGVFFHPVFVRNGAKYLDLEDHPGTISYDGTALGASNLLVQKRSAVRAATIPLLYQYFGPIFYDNAFESKYLNDVLEYYRHSCDYIYFSLAPEFRSIQKLNSNWNILKSATLAVTENEFKSWGNYFRDDVRNKINKATRENVRIEQTDSLNEGLWGLTFTKKNIKPPIQPNSLKLWCSDLYNHSLIRLYRAMINEREVAFRGELIYGNFAYDWIAGSDPEYHSTGANQLLMAEIGSELRNEGIKIWDLVDGGIRGIADFKKSFGAVEFVHWHITTARGIKGNLFAAIRKIKNA